MEPMTIREIAECVHGILNMDDAGSVHSIETDTRTLTPRSLYIALVGERFDGHEFISQAFSLGAAAVISEQPVHATKPVILVRDAKQALGKIAEHYAAKFSPLTVGVTGSVGKTSTKEMIALVLEEKYETCKTQGNLNNEIGLPKTLLSLTPFHTALVVEMGMSALGEISYLSKLAKPHLAVITNIGTSHLATLGSQENILTAKLEILDGLREDGRVILNADDPMLAFAGTMFSDQVIFYGIRSKRATVRAEDVRVEGASTKFSFVYEGNQYPALLPVVGKHNVYNALAGFAVGIQAGISPEVIAERVKAYQPEGMRGQIRSVRGVTMIVDCYNANPDSMRSALDVISQTPCEGRRIAVLGDMLNLGEDSALLHRQVGELTQEYPVDFLVCCGERSQDIAAGAKAVGQQTVWFATKEEAVCDLKQRVQPGDVVILKASRGMALEQIMDEMVSREDE